MFAPCFASSRATDRIARALTGLPRTTTAWVGHRGPSGIGTDFDVDVHSDRRHRLFEFFLKRLGIVRAGDHDAECQSTSNHHLLHVE